MEVSPYWHPWTGRQAYRGQGLPNQDRTKDLLDCIAIQQMIRSGRRGPITTLMQGAYADVSQSHNRKCYSVASQPVHTITTSTLLYSYGLDSVVLQNEIYRWHGFPRTLGCPDQVSDMRSLVGNSMCAPCLGQALAVLCIMLKEI